MHYLKFQTWLEATMADFGVVDGNKQLFNTHPDETPIETMKRHVYDKPVKMVNVDYLTEQLAKRDIGLKRANLRFMNEVTWGEGQGALKLNIQPHFNVFIKKSVTDLEGSEIWYTKKVFVIDRSGFGGHEPEIIEEMYKELNRINELESDTPKAEVDKHAFKDLINRMSVKMEQVARPIFIFEGIKQVSDFNYIIKFGIKGHGLEAPSQRRVEAVLTQVYHDPKRGLVRLMLNDIESPVGGPHSWKVMPTHTEFIFMPTQDKEEIINTIATTIKYY